MISYIFEDKEALARHFDALAFSKREDGNRKSPSRKAAFIETAMALEAAATTIRNTFLRNVSTIDERNNK
jgi:hypothetical protein